MKRISYISILIYAVIISPLSAQQTVAQWEKWEYLIGDWIGEGNGKPGMGSGSFCFRKELDDKVLVRKSHTEFLASDAQPASIHDDLMVVYSDFPGSPPQAIYFDNEGHTIKYEITYTEDKIVLTSMIIPNVPRFQLTYQKLDYKTVNILFAIASPQNQEEFKTYLEGKSLKAN